MTMIEVAYATPSRQKKVECEIEPGTSLSEAVKLSSILQHFPEIQIETCVLGVCGNAVRA